MKCSDGLAILGILALGAALALATGRTHGVYAQGCPPPAYTNEVFPWPKGIAVNFSFDSDGTHIGNASDPFPKFMLGSNEQGLLALGIKTWNDHSSSDGTSVAFAQGSTSGPFNWIISTAWPQASVTYTASNGQTYTWPVDASSTPPGTAAVTFYLPDYNSTGGYTGTAGAAVTLINTNGTYSAFGNTYLIWDPNGGNFANALQEIGAHETGHGFGLDDQSQCGDVMSHWGPATSSNPSGGTNNQGGCATAVVTACDDVEVANNYNPPPPQPPPSGGCTSNADCTCGGTCEKDGTCTYTFDCSPILIAVGQNADIQLTSAQDGVWFDLEASGTRQWVAWTRAGEPVAFLVWDRNHNGIIDNGSELFGNHTLLPNGQVAPNGFYALAAYDLPENGGNGDGVINTRDAIWSQLQLWIDWNHNGFSEPNELYRPEDFGLTQISLDYQTANRGDQFGNLFRLQAPCQLAGKVRFGYDVYFTARPAKKP